MMTVEAPSPKPSKMPPRQPKVVKHTLKTSKRYISSLLEDDSQFQQYLNCDLIKNVLNAYTQRDEMRVLFYSDEAAELNARTLLDCLSFYFVTKNVSLNNCLEYYLPRLIDMAAFLMEVERCSLYLFDAEKDELYCKVTTGKLKEPICVPRRDGKSPR